MRSYVYIFRNGAYGGCLGDKRFIPGYYHKWEVFMLKAKKIFTNLYAVIFFALLCNALWGSAFSCVKLGYEWFDVVSTGDKLLFAGLRFMLAGILVILFYSAANKRLIYPAGKAEWGRVLSLCMFQTVLQYLFFYIGLSNTSGVKASIVEGSNVFVAILIACLIPVRVKTDGGVSYVRQEKMSARILIGCILGFIGVVIVNVAPGGFDSAFRMDGEGFVFISTIAYGVSTVFIKKYSKESDTVMLSGWQFFVGGIILMIIGILSGGNIGDVQTRGCFMLLYLAMVSAVAYTLWGVLLKYNPIARIAVFGFSNPVFGVMLSAILLKEGSMLDFKCIIALAFVCVGIYIVNRRKEG